AASELVRVCRSGGRIGLANWTPEGFVGQLFRVIGKYVPPPAGLEPPARWGSRSRLEELFGAAGSIESIRRHFNFRYRSPGHFIDVFRTWYGPMNRAFAALKGDRVGLLGFTEELIALLESENRSGGDGLVVPAEYLEVVILKGDRFRR